MNTNDRFLHYQAGELVFGPKKKAIRDFLTSYQGPFYLYDLDFIEQRYKKMKEALPNVQLFYAMKANSHPEVLKRLEQLGAGADVVSGGEIKRALEVGFTPERMVYSGVGKTRAEIEMALDLNILQINVESLPELSRIVKLAKGKNKKAPVAFRLNPDVSVNTHPYIATGLRENKFGIELSQLEDLLLMVREHRDCLKVCGISLHLGSQMHDFISLDLALERLVPVFKKINDEFPDASVFDFGGGLGVFYEEQNLAQENHLLEKYAAVISDRLGGLKCSLQSEPGRWLVAHAGVLVTQVQYVKRTPFKSFVIVDTGMNHLLRPALYEAHHEIWSLRESSEKIVVDVVGPICESADFLGKNREIFKVEEDSFIVIQDAGAYGASMSSTYNLQSLPEEKYF